MATADRIRPKAVARWPMSLGILLALGSALGGFTGVFSDAGWWFVAVGVSALVLGAVAGARSLLSQWYLPPLLGFVVLVVCLTFSFASGFAWVGVIPNFEVLSRFLQLTGEGMTSINQQAIPAEPVNGIVFVITAGAGLLAIALDGLAFVIRRPALIGLPLLVLLLVPGTLDRLHGDPFFFILTAIAYLFVLYLGGGEVRAGGAAGVAAGGIAIAVLLPLVLPPLLAGHDAAARGSGFAVSVDSFITLGDDLRRGRVSRVITYTTGASEPEYLKLSTLDNFSGTTWRPTPPKDRAGATLDTIGPVPGLSEEISTQSIVTNVTVLDMGGHWLPAPYAPATITGATGSWSWNPENLSIGSESASSRSQKYSVRSIAATPTEDQLRASGVTRPPGLDRYLAVPDDLPDIVSATATEVAGDQPTNFDKAMALQDYFTGGEFTYSTEAPVAGGYDGTSALVIAAFLRAKSGYCVHFSSAMAMMARTLGIPARIAVGFTPGELVKATADSPSYYQVTTENLHAWPELYFNDIGWVRFEPTVGRGVVPDFSGDDASTPTDPDAAPTATPTATATPTPTAIPTATTAPTSSDTGATGSSGADFWVPLITVVALAIVALVILLLPLLPILVRVFRRLTRYWRVWRRGSAPAAWAELNDTAVDLGWSAATTTPREFSELVRRGFPEKAAAALERLRVAVEATAYSRDRGTARAADLRVVRRAMARVSTRRERFGAVVSPQSVPSLRRGRDARTR